MRRWLSVLASLVLLTQCDGTETDNPAAPQGPEGTQFVRSSKAHLSSVTVPGADAQSLQDGNLAFALDLYRQVATAASPDANLFLSPYSVSTVMAMTYGGARGATASQMAAALHFTLDQTALHPAFNGLRQSLKASVPTLVDLDALWLGSGCKMEGGFLDLLSEQYDTGVYLVDFAGSAEQSRLAINGWVAEKTSQKVSELLPPGSVDERTVFALTNALYFSAPWQYPFDPNGTRDGPFTVPSGEQVTVPMMGREAIFPHASSAGWEATAFGYLGTPLWMAFVLPAEGQFSAFEASFDASVASEITSALAATAEDLYVSVPKFSFAYDLDLQPPLQNLGMTDAFGLGTADFSGIAACDLAIRGAWHSTYVGVDEVGTVAAGASAVVGSRLAPTPSITLNRPFLFFIWDPDTKTVLFLGRLVRPAG